MVFSVTVSSMKHELLGKEACQGFIAWDLGCCERGLCSEFGHIPGYDLGCFLCAPFFLLILKRGVLPTCFTEHEKRVESRAWCQAYAQQTEADVVHIQARQKVGHCLIIWVKN